MHNVESPFRNTPEARLVDQALTPALRDMLDDNETITVRALVRRMGTVGHASTITRDRWRMARVVEWQAEQARVRSQIERSDKTSRTNLANQLEIQKARVSELEAERNLMCGAMLAMVQAIGEMGGMRAWHRFFDQHSEALRQLRTIGALPSAAVLPMPAAAPVNGRNKVKL